MTRPMPVLTEIQKAVEVIVGQGRGRIVEVRAPNTPEGTWSGYYNRGALIQDVFDLSSKETTPNVYWTIQEIKPELLEAGRENKLYAHSSGSTDDSQVARYIWLPIDCDPVRNPKVSSTESEKAAAIIVAQKVQEFLRARDIESILADSGNGYHVLVPLDILNQNGTNKLVEKVLKALNARFGNAAVGIDTSVFNPSRILKVYGSVARKGEHTDERPWRLSKIINVPANLIPLSEARLKGLLDEIVNGLTPEKTAEVNAKKTYQPPAAGTQITSERNNAVRDYAWYVWRNQTSDAPDAEDLKAKVYQFNSEFCVPPLDESELDRTVLSSTVKKRRAKDEEVRTNTLSTAVTNLVPVPELDTSGLTAYPEFPRWVLVGTTIDNGLVRPVVEASSKYPELVFMPAVQVMLNYLFGRVRIKDQSVNLNMYLGLISPYGKFFKSSCCELAHKYFECAGLASSYKTSMSNADGKIIIMQIGSTEGFGKTMPRLSASHAIIYNDELSKMVSKAGIESSSYAYDLLSWYGSGEWGNTVLTDKNQFTFPAGSYAFSWQWCTTDRGFNRQWPRIADMASGMEDRLFFTLSPKEPKPTTPYKDPAFQEGAIKTRQAIDAAVDRGVFEYEDAAGAVRILNGMDPRSMQLVQMLALYFAVDLQEDCITPDCLERAEGLVKYRNAVRDYLEPIEADNQQGRIQKEILRELKQAGGKLKYRDLCLNMDYGRFGTYVWKTAFTGMLEARMIVQWDEQTPSGRTAHWVGIPKVEDE